MTFTDSLWQDVSLSIRRLRRRPSFAGLAIGTLAFGVGINATIFTLLNSLSVSSIPYLESRRLVVIRHAPAVVFSSRSTSNEILNWAPRAQPFQTLTAYYRVLPGANLNGGLRPERVTLTATLPNFFRTLGIRPLFGADFASQSRGSAIISYRLWIMSFGASPETLGKQITLNGLPYTIEGIGPPGFSFPPGTDVWTTFSFKSTPKEGAVVFTDATVLGRLKEGMSLKTARAEMRDFSENLQELTQARLAPIILVPVSRFEGISLRDTFLILFGAAWLILLITCTTFGNLLFVHMVERRAEISVRVALGAGLARLVQQIMIDIFLLCLTGGTLGFLLTCFGVEAIRAFTRVLLPYPEAFHADVRVFGFAIGVSILAGSMSGIPSAIRVLCASRQRSLTHGDESYGTTHHPALNGALVAFEVATTVIVLVITGLSARSFANVLHVSLGYSPENVLTASIWPAGPRYAKDNDYYPHLLKKVLSIPGVEAAGATSFLPLAGGSGAHLRFRVSDSNRPSDPTVPVLFSTVTAGYFPAMGMSLLAGGNFTASDMQSGSKAAAIVSRTFASRYWPGRDAVGELIELGGREYHIKGVVPDVRPFSLDEDTNDSAQVYLAFPNSPLALSTIVIRSHVSLQDLLSTLRNEAARLNPHFPVYNIYTMKDRLSETLALRRMTLFSLGSMAACALFLGGIGLIAISSEQVAARMREISVRITLGAQASQLCRMIVTSSLKPILVGVCAGLGSALVLDRLLRAFLFRVSPTDPLTLSSVAFLSVGLAAFAVYLPTRRAVRQNPAEILRPK